MSPDFDRALAVLAEGGVVAAATETLFGLLADTTSRAALDRLFELKPRSDKGTPVILPDRAAWAGLVRGVPEAAARLADAFWPGPLTLVLDAHPDVDPRLLLNGALGVRWPSPSPAATLAARLGRPLSATSANLTGQPPTALAGEVRRAFAEAVAGGSLFVLDDPAPGGPPSTVVVVRSNEIEVVREGAISTAELRRIVAF
jgi:L-threonylcarbamoyladenylate synthase